MWRALVEGLERLSADAWLGAACALVLSLIVAVNTWIQHRAAIQMRLRLDELEEREANRTARDTGPTIQEFCQQIMQALGTETPAAVSDRLSEAAPSRFARVLAVYTRAQRRRLVTLYQQAESLREALSLEESRQSEEQGEKLRELDRRIETAMRQTSELEAACERANGMIVRLEALKSERCSITSEDLLPDAPGVEQDTSMDDFLKEGLSELDVPPAPEPVEPDEEPAVLPVSDVPVESASSINEEIKSLTDLIAGADRRAETLREIQEQASASIERMRELDSSLTLQLENRKELTDRIDHHLRERQLLLVSDILRAESKRLELGSALGQLESMVASLQQAAGIGQSMSLEPADATPEVTCP